jgi:serine/threonine-protein kinase
VSDQKICPTCGSEYPLSERFCPRDGTALRSSNAQADLIGSIVAERYHILKKLGEGGMGTVYLAEHVKMGRKAALKVMNPGMHADSDAIARFNREAANASRLNHPNICGIYDFGETPEGLIYLAMEFIEGESLTSLIEKNGALAPPRAAAIIHQAADALAVAHDAGIVHRDLKPDNIMIAKGRDNTDLVKVVDFGIAKASSSDAQKVTKTGLVVGTPEYMSPEQLSGDKLDGRSDIYSLGLVAFNCLTGKLPFASNSAQEAMIMRLTDAPKTLSETRPDVAWPDELQAVMDRALSRDVATRYQSAAEFGREMAKAVSNMPQTLAAAAGTQVMGAAPTAAVPRTRVAGGADGARTVATPAVAAGGPAKRRPVAMIAVAAVVVIGVGVGVVMMMNKGGSGVTQVPPDAAPAGEAGKAAPAGDTKSGGGTTATVSTSAKGGEPMSKSVVTHPADPGRSGGAAVTPGTGGSAAPPDFAVKWKAVLEGEEIGSAEAQKLIAEVAPIADGLSGERQGIAYYLLGMAHLQLHETAESCGALRRAKPLVRGNVLTTLNLAFDGNCK